MLTISICDDNPQFSIVLANALRKLCAFTLPDRIECSIGPLFGSAEELFSYLEKQSIDILFLDIDMPKKNGFDAASIINKKYPNTIIVFVSSYDGFVFNSFEYNPLRFLRKSHLKEELPNTLKKAVDKCYLDKESITLKSIEGTVVIRIKDIMYFESDKNYYTVYCASGNNYRCRGTLNSISEMLRRYDFFRTHSAYIISFEHIEIVRGRCDVEMKNHARIPLALSKAEAFHNQYTEYTRRNLFR